MRGPSGPQIQATDFGPMWDRLSAFLFGQFTILGFDFEPWMILIAMPVAALAVYYLEHGRK
jgi:hypothetical protein